jgi:hypothetical protein
MQPSNGMNTKPSEENQGSKAKLNSRKVQPPSTNAKSHKGAQELVKCAHPQRKGEDIQGQGRSTIDKAKVIILSHNLMDSLARPRRAYTHHRLRASVQQGTKRPPKCDLRAAKSMRVVYKYNRRYFARTTLRRHVLTFNTRAGTPATITFAGTLLVTTLPAAMTEERPIVTPGRIMELAPIHTSSSIKTPTLSVREGCSRIGIPEAKE